MFPPMPGDSMSPWVELWREEAEPVTVLSAKVGCGGLAADNGPSNRSSRLVLCVCACVQKKEITLYYVCLLVCVFKCYNVHMVAFDVGRKHLIQTQSLLKPHPSNVTR